jgi:phosphoglycolate phosphatase-like HAD superfamily hydrolase
MQPTNSTDPVRHLLFDIDGTLMVTGNAGVRALHRALTAAFGINDLPEVPFGGRTDQFILREMLAVSKIEPSDANFERFRAEYAVHLPATLADGGGQLLPGIRDLLETLVKDGRFTLGLLSGNLPEAAQSKLEFFGIDHFFDHGVFGDHSHDRRELAAEAAAILRHKFGDYDPHHVWIIGDTELDIVCGRHIGAKIIACCTGAHSKEQLENSQPDFLFDTLLDRDAIIRCLISG